MSRLTLLAIAPLAYAAVGAGPVRIHEPVQACAAGAPVVFLNAALLTMDSDTMTRGATVLVRDGRIAAINPSGVPSGVCRVDAAGAVLMPGLADMHVHTSEREMPLFLANGVTFVREMNGSPVHLALRDRITRGEVIGPSMLVTSPLLVGAPLRFRHILVTTPDDASRVAREHKDAGYDFLKIYDGLSRPVYDAFVDAGRALQLRLDGHIPQEVGLARAVEAGQSFQHMDKLAVALAQHTGDTARYAEARRLFAGRNAWVTPTIASLRVLDLARTAEYTARFERPEMAYVDSGSIGWWRSLAGTGTRTEPSRTYRFQIGLLGALRQSGVRFLLGTDAANPMMIAGFAVHEELAALVRDGGFTPYEALRTATRNIGEFVGDSLRGRLAPGAPADLVLVAVNPLTDLGTLRRPLGVMIRGRWLTRPQLDSMLASAKRR